MGFQLNELCLASPLAVVALGSLMVLLLDVFSTTKWARELAGAVTLVAALVALGKHWDDFTAGHAIFSGAVMVDPLTGMLFFVMIVGALFSLLIGSSYVQEEGIDTPGEYYSLMLMALFGAMVLVSAGEMITFFIGLEIMSLALYSLCASATGKPRSSEAGMKYFLLGSFSSAFLLYGMALLYGLTGSLLLSNIAVGITHTDPTLTAVAIGLVLFGLVFKIGIVPFHFWTPDVYQGAPTPVTIFMASVIKVASVGAALRLLLGTFGAQSSMWAGALCAMAALTMVIGNITALQQRSVKRMLAYSSVAHAGYMLVGFLASGGGADGAAAVLFYLVVYCLMTFGSFGVLQVVSSMRGGLKDSDDISSFQGLGVSHPYLAAVMSLFLLALAGLPPGVGGLVGKFYIFGAAIHANYILLSVLGVLCSAISCYYYLRVIVAMYFVDTPATEDARPIEMPLALSGTVALCAVGVVLVGIFPSAVYQLAQWASIGL